MFEAEHDRSKRTASATFRISEKAYHALQNEAERQDTSLNTLVNQVFDSHVNSSYLPREAGLHEGQQTHVPPDT